MSVVEAVALKLYTEHVKRYGAQKPTSKTIVRVVIDLLAAEFDRQSLIPIDGQLDDGLSVVANYLRAALSEKP